MKTPAVNPIKPLLPTLPDAADKRTNHDVSVLRGGDQLHLKTRLLGFPKGAVLPVHGYCTLFDEDGRAYSVRAYVRPLDMAQAVGYQQREAVRFRFENQQERWFGSVLMYLVELDLTDYADCLRLERAPAVVAEALGYEVRQAA